MHREPDLGLNPGSPGSGPGPKAGTKPLGHPGIPEEEFRLLFLLSARYYPEGIKEDMAPALTAGRTPSSW